MNRSKAAILLAILILGTASLVPAQVTGDDLRKALRTTAQFTDAEIESLDHGEIVVKVLKSKEKRQIGVFGIVRLQQVPGLSVVRFREALAQRSNKSVVTGGRFSSPPVIDDLRALKLDKSDLDDLKSCEPGNCKLKLPAEMITKLREVAAADAVGVQSDATRLFSQFLVGYVADYTARGNAALAVYDNETPPVRIADEQHHLLEESPLIDSLAPEFVKYLEAFPAAAPAGIESTVDWTKLTFGLKPFMTVTHSISYDQADRGSLRYLIATRQIYATRYVDSSLALSMFVRVAAETGLSEDYLIFTDVSRSDALGGALSGIKRSVVGAEASSRVNELLQRAKTKLEASPHEDRQPEPDPPGFIESTIATLGGPIMITVLAVFVLATLYIAVRKYRT